MAQAASPPLFVDTSAWVALIHRRDQHHSRALQLWPGIRDGQRELVTTGLVAGETHALLLRRRGAEAAATFVESLLTSRLGHVVWTDATITRNALERWLRGFDDQLFTLVDAVSFEVMRREGIREAFTFDKDFERAGFKTIG